LLHAENGRTVPTLIGAQATAYAITPLSHVTEFAACSLEAIGG